MKGWDYAYLSSDIWSAPLNRVSDKGVHFSTAIPDIIIVVSPNLWWSRNELHNLHEGAGNQTFFRIKKTTTCKISNSFKEIG